MAQWAPPICFLLALAALVTGFALLAYGSPEVGIELLEAEAMGDEDYQEVLEEQLTRRLRNRYLLLGALFGGSVALVVSGFALMKPSGQR